MKLKSVIYTVFLVGLLLTVLFSCQKKDNNESNIQLPTLTTERLGGITFTIAYGGGTITSDGGDSITTRGICWSINKTPTIADSKSIDITDPNHFGNYFNSHLNSLSANTTYYYRTYAVNKAGTGYGNVRMFVTDCDGNLYNVETIGTQVWMLENLKTTKYRNGDLIPNISNATQWSNLITGAYCFYNNNLSNEVFYGALYNWFSLNDKRNLAPTGWHVASDTEWTTLINYLGGESVAALKLNNVGEIGFAQFGGLRNSDVSVNFTAIYNNSFWWSSTQENTIQAWGIYLASNSYNPSPALIRNSHNMKYGLSVRCVKD